MLRVLIVDDEAPARDRLRQLLQPMIETGRIAAVEEAVDGFEALEKLNEKAFDLVFLDIQMPELDGFSMLERLAPGRRPAIVFVTAFNDYAIRAFDANASDYLLKPVSSERLGETLNRIERSVQHQERARPSDDRVDRLLDWLDAQDRFTRPSESRKPATWLKQLSIPLRDRILVVPVSRLVTAELNEGICRLHVIEELPASLRTKLRQHVVGYTLEQLEETLDPESFIRVHRSAIVGIEHIQEIIPWFSGRYKLILTGGHEVVASRERSRVLRDRLML